MYEDQIGEVVCRDLITIGEDAAGHLVGLYRMKF